MRNIEIYNVLSHISGIYNSIIVTILNPQKYIDLNFSSIS